MRKNDIQQIKRKENNKKRSEISTALFDGVTESHKSTFVDSFHFSS